MVEKDLEKNIIQPDKMFREAQIFRFSKIFYNMSITCFILMLSSFLSTILAPVLFLFALLLLFFTALAIIVFSLGTVFAMPNNPAEYVWNLLGALLESGNKMQIIISFCFSLIKWLAIVGLILSIISIVFTALSKKNGKVTKIILLSIMIIISIVVLALHLISGGGV